jgi:hypothetical protein
MQGLHLGYVPTRLRQVRGFNTVRVGEWATEIVCAILYAGIKYVRMGGCLHCFSHLPYSTRMERPENAHYDYL